MMGHTVITNMKGVEYPRNIYASSGLSIRPKTTISKIERLKMFVESLGLNPDEDLSRDALAMPHRTLVDPPKQRLMRETFTHVREYLSVLSELLGYGMF